MHSQLPHFIVAHFVIELEADRETERQTETVEEQSLMLSFIMGRERIVQLIGSEYYVMHVVLQ